MNRSRLRKNLLSLVMLTFSLSVLLYSCTFFKTRSDEPETVATPAVPAPRTVASIGGTQEDEYENPSTIPTPFAPFARENRDPYTITKDWPVDAEGNPDWVAAFKEGIISPREAIEDKKPVPPFNFDIEIPAVGAMPDVVFPHFPHTYWLDCGNCHPSIFVMKRGANPISMVKIVNGEFCGRCHGRVAFPISNCLRCHVKPKE